MLKTVGKNIVLFLRLLFWNGIIISVFWSAEVLYEIILKLVNPQYYFHTDHFPSLIVVFALVFALSSLIILGLIRIFYRKFASTHKSIYAISTILIVLSSIIGFADFRLFACEMNIKFSTLNHINTKLIIIDILLLFFVIVSFIWWRKLVYKFSERKWIIAVGMVTVLFCYSIDFALSQIDLNRFILPRISENDSHTNRPNVVLAIVDNLRRDYVGGYGDTLGLTPNIDAISEESVRFGNAYSASPWTAPSFAGFYTSRYPYEIFLLQDEPKVSQGKEGSYFMFPVNKIKAEQASLTSILKEAGYFVATLQANSNAGATFNFDLHNDFYMDCYNQTRNANLLFLFYAGIVRSTMKFWGITDEMKIPLLNTHLTQYCAFAKNLTDYATNLIKRVENQPFLLIVNYMDVHEYHKRYPKMKGTEAIAEVYPDEYDRYSFAVNAKYCDEQLGRLYGFLEKEALLNNTIFIIISDHGEQFGEHGYNGIHGTSVYNEEIKVPFIIRYPDKFPPGTVRKENVSLLDILPTVLGMCEISIDEFNFSGINLCDSIVLDRDLFTGQMLYTKDKNALVFNHHKILFDSLEGNYKYFDLSLDPQELHPLSINSLGIGAELLPKLQAWQIAMKEAQIVLETELEASGEVGIFNKEELKSIGYIK
jgi:arylsulfatase A-like enzyme